MNDMTHFCLVYCNIY